MEAQEWGRVAAPCDEHGTGTEGSPVGHRSRLVDVDRELRFTDQKLVPDSRLESRESSTDNMAFDQQAVPPLTSAALRGLPHRATDPDSGSRRSPLTGLGAPLPGLRSDALSERISTWFAP